MWFHPLRWGNRKGHTRVVNRVSSNRTKKSNVKTKAEKTISEQKCDLADENESFLRRQKKKAKRTTSNNMQNPKLRCNDCRLQDLLRPALTQDQSRVVVQKARERLQGESTKRNEADEAHEGGSAGGATLGSLNDAGGVGVRAAGSRSARAGRGRGGEGGGAVAVVGGG